MRLHGNGIYTPDGYASFFYSEDNTEKLLVSDLAIIRRRKISNVPNSDLIRKQFKPHHNNGLQFKTKLFRDTYDMKLLTKNAGNVSVCQHDVCCYLSYEKNEKK